MPLRRRQMPLRDPSGMARVPRASARLRLSSGGLLPLLAGLLLFTALIPAAHRAAAETGAGVEGGGPVAHVVEYGLYEIRRVGRRVAPDTVGGWVGSVAAAHHLRETDLVNGQLDTTFGMRVRFSGLPVGAPLTIRTLHPPKTNPETGRTMSTSTYDSAVGPDRKGVFLFTFDEPWELAEGDWTLQVIHDDRVIGEKAFKVVIPLN